MKRKKHEIETKNKILKVARKLFQEDGYQSTTIRKITNACGIQIGSLYHFYRDKEDIFFHIVSEIFDRVIEKATELADEDDPYLKFACESTWHILSVFSNAKTAELYNIAFSSPSISQNVMKKRIEHSRALFGGLHPNFQERDYKIRAMMINGYLQALSLDASQRPLQEDAELIYESIRIFLGVFLVPDQEIATTIAKLIQLDVPTTFASYRESV